MKDKCFPETQFHLFLSQKQLIFISWARTHKDKTVIPEILAPMDRKAPMSFSKLSTVGEKKKYVLKDGRLSQLQPSSCKTSLNSTGVCPGM